MQKFDYYYDVLRGWEQPRVDDDDDDADEAEADDDYYYYYYDLNYCNYGV